MTTIQKMAGQFVAGATRGKHHGAEISGDTYFLHGNPIAKRTDKGVVYDWCGWYTPTTQNHMDHILSAEARQREGGYWRTNPGVHKTWGVTQFRLDSLLLIQRVVYAGGRGPNRIQKRYRLPTT